MAKSRKNFAKQNGRKKAKLARKDTVKRKVQTKRLTRLNLDTKTTEEKVQEDLAKMDIGGTREEEEWTDVGTVTTGGGLRMTPQQKEKVRQMTRRQTMRKTKHQNRGESYAQRLQQERRESMARRIKKKIAGKVYREEVKIIRENKETFD